jgi:predicted metal-dependent peptidase
MIEQHTILDPDSYLTRDESKECCQKLETVRTGLVRPPKHGGCPFLFAFAANKPDIIAKFSPGKINYPVTTAATDGTSFFWNPDFLKKISHWEATIVMMHEMYHCILLHNINIKSFDYKIISVVNDFIVNAIVWREVEFSGCKISPWGKNIGLPLSLENFISYLDGDQNFDGLYCYADKSVYDINRKDLYSLISNHWNDSPRKCPKCNSLTISPKTGEPFRAKPYSHNACQTCGELFGTTTMDIHLPLKHEDNTFDLRLAKNISENISKGSTPKIVEDKIGHLIDPEINFLQYIKNLCVNISKDNGLHNNWKRPKKRFLHNKIYLPHKNKHITRWLCLVDMSGSMTIGDIRLGLSQLATLIPHTSGYVVPCDNKTFWENITKIDSYNDILSIKTIGRGLTDFSDFFLNYNKHIKDIDLIIVLTDGMCPNINKELRPRQSVVWGVTSGIKNFKPPFGKVANLKC